MTVACTSAPNTGIYPQLVTPAIEIPVSQQQNWTSNLIFQLGEMENPDTVMLRMSQDISHFLSKGNAPPFPAHETLNFETVTECVVDSVYGGKDRLPIENILNNNIEIISSHPVNHSVSDILMNAVDSSLSSRNFTGDLNTNDKVNLSTKFSNSLSVNQQSGILRPEVESSPTSGIKVKSTKNVVIGGKVAKRIWDKVNYCIFCGKGSKGLARHLQQAHKTEIEVKEALSFPLRSEERRQIWKKLLHKGNYAHNQKIYETGTGQLVVAKRDPSGM